MGLQGEQRISRLTDKNREVGGDFKFLQETEISLCSFNLSVTRCYRAEVIVNSEPKVCRNLSNSSEEKMSLFSNDGRLRSAPSRLKARARKKNNNKKTDLQPEEDC